MLIFLGVVLLALHYTILPALPFWLAILPFGIFVVIWLLAVWAFVWVANN